MDKKDEIIAEQLELIRKMTERNVRRLSDDIWEMNRKPSDSALCHDSIKTDSPRTVNAETKASAGAPGDSSSNEGDDTPKPEQIEDLLCELDGYIGLEHVKEEVRSLINMAKVYKMRRDHGLPVGDVSLHMVFSGNPGTGKTMIARFMARVYHSIGLLSKGHLVETDRSGLVAGYIGQTAIKTTDVLKRALGGVLFIDEAYSLTEASENDFGSEAVDTVLKYMEDNRDDIVVIVAGYTELMESFVDSNPGLRSRFNKYVEFEDYTAEEMTEILRMNCDVGLYTLDEDAEAAAHEYFMSKAADAASFGNARGVRNAFEKILSSQANRLATSSDITREDLIRITRADVEDALGYADGMSSEEAIR